MRAPGPVRAAGRRLGYRGAALLVTGVGWVNYGAGMATDPRYGTVRGVDALVQIAPIWVWGWVWITSGVVSCAAAPLRSGRDWWGWIAAAGMPAIWACAYSGARALGTLPQGWYAAMTWAVYPVLLALIAAATRRLIGMRREVATLRRAVATAARTQEERRTDG